MILFEQRTKSNISIHEQFIFTHTYMRTFCMSRTTMLSNFIDDLAHQFYYKVFVKVAKHIVFNVLLLSAINEPSSQ